VNNPDEMERGGLIEKDVEGTISEPERAEFVIFGLARALRRARTDAGDTPDIGDIFMDNPHWSPPAPTWLAKLVELAATGHEVIVELDNDSQTAFDATVLDEIPKDEREHRWLELETPETPREMVIDLFKALGITARGV
jgi:hypothetical protein